VQQTVTAAPSPPIKEASTSGIAALAGKSRLSKATPVVPAETAGSVRADVEEIKERTQHR
jgi:hypothetical protein